MSCILLEFAVLWAATGGTGVALVGGVAAGASEELDAGMVGTADAVVVVSMVGEGTAGDCAVAEDLAGEVTGTKVRPLILVEPLPKRRLSLDNSQNIFMEKTKMISTKPVAINLALFI
jgi:hypothetical protein